MNSLILEKLKRIMVLIRFDIYNKDNIKIVKALLLYFGQCNDIKKFDESIQKINVKIANQIQHKNDDFIIEKDINYNIEKFIVNMLKLLCNMLANGMYNKAYDITDMLQGLPDYLYLIKKRNFKKYWKIYVEPYILKYNAYELENLKKDILKK